MERIDAALSAALLTAPSPLPLYCRRCNDYTTHNLWLDDTPAGAYVCGTCGQPHTPTKVQVTK